MTPTEFFLLVALFMAGPRLSDKFAFRVATFSLVAATVFFVLELAK